MEMLLLSSPFDRGGNGAPGGQQELPEAPSGGDGGPGLPGVTESWLPMVFTTIPCLSNEWVALQA